MATTNSIEDYTHLLNFDYWDFIRQVNSYFPENFSALIIEEQRAVYNTMLRHLLVELPENLHVQDQVLETAAGLIPTRSYQIAGQAARAQIIYFHGGGFVLGGLDSHHGICADLCAGTGLSLTAVDYRLAPEHLFPAALDDALAAYQALATQTALPLILMGDSAGACLAAHVAHAMRGKAQAPLVQVLIYPVLGSDFSLDSYERYALAPLLTSEDMHYYWRIWLGMEDIPLQVQGIPLADTNFSDLPKTIIFSAECDPLVDEARLYCEKIKAAGGQAVWQHERGLAHGYLHARHQVASAQASFARIQEAIKRLVA